MSAGTTTKRAAKVAAIYTRISLDDEGDALGVTRQREDCEALVKRQRWQLANVYVDNDVSASRYSRKRRPQYDAMMHAVERGEIDVIVAYNLDRLYRQPKELERLIDLADKGTVEVVTLSGDFDLSNGDQRMTARLLVSVAAHSSDASSRRIKRAAEQRAQMGKPSGGRPGFGWIDATTVDPTQARYVREVTAKFLAGASIAELARWLNTEQAPTAGGVVGGWQVSSVSTLLRSARNAGLVMHNGHVLADVHASWPTIVEPADYNAAQDRLAAPERVATPRRRTAFTGLIRCGDCKHVMKRTSNNGRTMWRCYSGPGRNGACGKLSITADVVEDFIVTRALEQAATLDLASAAPDADVDRAALDEVARLEAKLREVQDGFARDEFDYGSMLRMSGTIQQRLKDARAALGSKASARQRSRLLDGLAERWNDDEFTDDMRRAALAELVERVDVKRAPRRGPGVPIEQRASVKFRV